MQGILGKNPAVLTFFNYSSQGWIWRPMKNSSQCMKWSILITSLQCWILTWTNPSLWGILGKSRLFGRFSTIPHKGRFSGWWKTPHNAGNHEFWKPALIHHCEEFSGKTRLFGRFWTIPHKGRFSGRWKTPHNAWNDAFWKLPCNVRF